MVRAMKRTVLPLAVLLSLGVSQSARAEGTAVLVPPFQAQERGAESLARELGSAVLAEVQALDTIDLRPIEKVPAVGNLPAVEYAESCPPGQSVGCSFVLGGAAGVSLAVSGSVWALGDGALAEIHIVDVPNGVDLLSFQAELGRAEVPSFAQTVSRLLVAVAQGDVSLGGDIRLAAVVPTGTGVDKDLANRQLSQLESEIGGSGTVGTRAEGFIEREDMTEDDIAEAMQSDGVKPWEKVGMTPQEYMRYYNSGLRLHEWRQRKLGRKGQLLIRPWLGWGNGPFSGAYQGEKGLDGTTLETIEVYAWHALVQSSAFEGGASVAYGVLPELELGVGLGFAAGGQYTVQTHTVTEDNFSNPPDPQTLSQTLMWLGPELHFAPMPTWPARPVLGLRATWIKGRTVDQHVQLPDPDLPTFEALSQWRLGIVPGGEARIGERVDVFLHLPIDLTLGGKSSDTFEQGGGVLDDKKSPPALNSVSAGMMLGIQIRALGAKQKSGPMIGGGDPDEP